MEPRAHAAQDARHRFASSLQAALTLEEVENVFLEAANDVIPAGGFGLYRLDADSGSVVGMRAEVETDFLDDYEDYGRADDPVLDFVVEQRRPIDSSRVVAPQRWAECGARWALGVGGYAHSLEAPVTVAGTFFGTINFARSAAQPAFSDSDLVSARLASEQLGLAAERALRFEHTGRRASMLERALDRVPEAIVVTDLDAQVLFRNRSARKEPSLGGPAGNPVDESIAAAMTEFRLHGKRVHTRSVRDNATNQQLIVKSYRLSDNDDAAVTLIFTCADAQAERLPMWDVLSKREQDIAELVSQGLTTKQIAEHAFVSENTVKQHLKRVFAKTDVRNRAELVQLIWSSGRRTGPEAESGS